MKSINIISGRFLDIVHCIPGCSMLFEPGHFGHQLFLWSFLLLQGPSPQIDTFQTNIFSWLDDIMIKNKIFLNSWDREIWYKTFNIGIPIFLWSQYLYIWKIQWVVCLISCGHIQMKVKTKTNRPPVFDQFLTEPMLVQKKYIPHMKALKMGGQL